MQLILKCTGTTSIEVALVEVGPCYLASLDSELGLDPSNGSPEMRRAAYSSYRELGVPPHQCSDGQSTGCCPSIEVVEPATRTRLLADNKNADSLLCEPRRKVEQDWVREVPVTAQEARKWSPMACIQLSKLGAHAPTGARRVATASQGHGGSRRRRQRGSRLLPQGRCSQLV